MTSGYSQEKYLSYDNISRDTINILCFYESWLVCPHNNHKLNYLFLFWYKLFLMKPELFYISEDWIFLIYYFRTISGSNGIMNMISVVFYLWWIPMQSSWVKYRKLWATGRIEVCETRRIHRSIFLEEF